MQHRTLMPEIKRYLTENDAFRFSGTMELVYLKTSGDFYFYLLKDLASEPYLLKVAAKASVDSGLGNEYKVLRYLDDCPHTPNAYHYDHVPEGFDRDVLLMEYIPEEELDYTADYLKVAQIFGSIHRHGAELELPRLDDPLGLCLIRGKDNLKDALSSGVFQVDHLYFFDGFTEWAEEHLDRKRRTFQGVEPVICHGPFEMEDFTMQSPGYLYNWEGAYLGDAAIDITRFLARTTSLMEADVILRAIDREDFYFRWETTMGLEKSSLRERVNAYMPYYLFELFSSLARYYYDHAKPGAHELESLQYEKLQRYLDIEFMQSCLAEYI